MIEYNYLTIQGWMTETLELKGTELLIYALIYGFCQAKNKSQISLAYIAKWTGCTKRAIINNLKKLEKNKLIKCKKTQGKATNYLINWSIIEEIKQNIYKPKNKKINSKNKNNFKKTSEKSSLGGEKSSPVTSEKSSPQIIINNNYSDNRDNKARAREEEQQFIKPPKTTRFLENTKRFERPKEEEQKLKEYKTLREILAYNWLNTKK